MSDDQWVSEEAMRAVIDAGAYFDIGALEEHAAEAYPDPALQNCVLRGAIAWVCKTMEVTIRTDGRLAPWIGDSSIFLSASYAGAAGMAWDLIKNWPGNPLDIAFDAPLSEVERKVLAPLGLGVRYEEDQG